ncbi:protein ENDOSPERM DEFECTIVE 1-like [Phragmites australis]|uniref:protein ENDOSPERM DEFECTIVE 1-like n=1 Tax=Phragmites australis TaxID=29695 RepID=UPI002D76C476|nr:protein ENDOSPERM DEFECTIVE 1-like [Phragmites australis]
MAAAAPPSPRPDMPPPPVPPATGRRPRPRAREVSSRYLSTPVPSTPRLSTASSSSTRSRSPTPSPRARTQRAGTPFANENHPPPPPPPTGTVARRRAVQKLFNEMGTNNPRASFSSNSSAVSASDSVPAATPRPLPRSSSGPAASTVRRGYPRLPTPARAGSCPTATPASAVVDSDAASCCSSSDTASTVTDFSVADGLGVVPAAPCESPPLLGQASCRSGRLSSELRASVPESGGSARASNPLCYRSLNSALSISTAAAGKASAAARPPQPQGAKAVELKKAAVVGGRKIVGKQEDVHQLRLLDNWYFQYRFLNARAEAAAKAMTAAAEKSLCGLAGGIAGLQESVAEKRAEVERIRREQRLCSVVTAQILYLDQWGEIERDHSSCLRGATTALHDVSLRLPIIGNIRANCGEIAEVLNSAVQLIEPLSPCVRNFLPKVENIDDVASNLSQVVATERALIEECGNLLYQAQNLQMREYSLRTQLVQLKQGTNTK